MTWEARNNEKASNRIGSTVAGLDFLNSINMTYAVGESA